MALFQFYLRVAVDDNHEDQPRIPFSLREPLPLVISTQQQVEDFKSRLINGSGPIAIDAERASGFTYSQRAYLIQLKRAGTGTALIDPTTVDLATIASLMGESEWILHAATQDLECLRGVGLWPTAIFDTELAGRLLGRERVGLAGLIASELGEHLEKGHGAANWSMRPLTSEMLTYAALDVELLIELRASLENSLRESNKWEIAQQEFQALVHWKPRAPSGEAWRRTSGVHAIRSPRQRAIVREMWITRDDIARRSDTAPGRILPDRAILAAAQSNSTSMVSLVAVKEFNGRGAKKYEHSWWAAIERAYSLSESDLPGYPPRTDAPPPPKAWAEKNPDAFVRLEFVKTYLAELSESMLIPVENLLLPEVIRQVTWDPPLATESDVQARLRAASAREWQIELVAPILWASRNASGIAEDSGEMAVELS